MKQNIYEAVYFLNKKSLKNINQNTEQSSKFTTLYKCWVYMKTSALMSETYKIKDILENKGQKLISH